MQILIHVDMESTKRSIFFMSSKKVEIQQITETLVHRDKMSTKWGILQQKTQKKINRGHFSFGLILQTFP